MGDVVKGLMELSLEGEIVQKEWLDIQNRFQNVQLDVFVVMPNHLHGIIEIIDDGKNVGAIHELPLQQRPRRMLIPKIIGRFKMQSSKQINILHNSQGKPIWQRNYYEHIIRNENELNKIRQYIIDNPAKWEFDRENPISESYQERHQIGRQYRKHP